MAQHQFVGAIVRMAHLRYASSHYGLGAALDKLLHDVIEPHVSNELQLEHDPFSVVTSPLSRTRSDVARRHSPSTVL
eukprot:2943347-Prymnesium_polylepis.1